MFQLFHRYKIIFLVFISIVSAFAAQQDLSFANSKISSPRDLASALESRIVSGEGILLPNPQLTLIINAGTIRLYDGDWPEPFHARSGSAIYVMFDPDTCRYEFRDLDGTLLWTELPEAIPPADWVASFLRKSEKPLPIDELFDPSRIVMRWNILGDSIFQHQEISRLDIQHPTKIKSSPKLVSDTQEHLSFSAFSLQGESTLSFSAKWPQGEPPQDGILDLYTTESIASNIWQRIATIPATNNPTFFSLTWPLNTNLSVRPTHSELCIAITNLMVSPLNGETIYTNIIWQCQHPQSTDPTSAFFRLGTRTDSDSDGLPDAFEILVSGTNLSKSDTDGDTMPDGWEVDNGFNPLDPLDAMQDADGDGLPNVYEFHNGTDPRNPDFSSAPRIVVGGTDENSVPNLESALSSSEPYSIIEIAPGTHSGQNWTGLWMPAHPVLVTSGDGGKHRDTVLRHTNSGLAAFYLDLEQSSHTAFQSLDIELAGTSKFQSAFWLGDGNLMSGPGASGFFRNVHIRLGRISSGDRVGWFCRHSTTNPVTIIGCTVDGDGTRSARGVYAVDSPDLFLENCSFLNFPDAATGPAYALQLESTATNIGGAPHEISVSLRNCLFDSSFSLAYPIAPLTNGVSYNVSLKNCIVPSQLPFPAEEQIDLIVADPLVHVSGHLTSCSPALNSGCAVMYATSDFDGEIRDSSPDIGADEYLANSSIDSDKDGLSNYDEIIYGSDPFRCDSDDDGIPDYVEVSEGTDPTDPRSVCFTLSGIVTAPNWTVCKRTRLAIVAPSNESWRVLASLYPTSTPPAISFAFPHQVVSDEQDLFLALFCDSDENGEFGNAETGGVVPFVLAGHETTVDDAYFDISNDQDSDGIPDWWEVEHGLSPTNALDAVEDPDGDGLINLHEYWHDLHPFICDGTNTVLSILARSIDERIIEKNPATALPVFENYLKNARLGTFVRNDYCWASDVDFSCASPWNTGDYGHWRAGTLISPRHILYSDHFKVPLNVDVCFVTPSGALEKRKHISRKTVPGTDICIGLLDAPVSTNLCIAKLLPLDWPKYLGSMLGIPAFGLDQEEKAIVFELRRMVHNVSFGTDFVAFGMSQIPNRQNLFESLVAYDSGNPLFLLFGDDVILLGCMHTATSVDACSSYLEDIQATMDELCVGYSLQTMSFAGYETVQ